MFRVIRECVVVLAIGFLAIVASRWFAFDGTARSFAQQPAESPRQPEDPPRVWPVELKPILPPRPVLADWPQFIAPVQYDVHFEGPRLVDQLGADLDVRSWHFSFNARGLVEVPNRLRADRTAIVVVHPWGINDGQGWDLPQPAGFAFGTPESIRFTADHIRKVINPFLKAWRGRAALIAYSLPGEEDPLRGKVYRSMQNRPAPGERAAGLKALSQKLKSFNYRAAAIPTAVRLPAEKTVVSYFQQLPCIDFGPKFNGPGYWDLPIPVHSGIEMGADDVVVYDSQGYAAFRDFLIAQRIENVFVCGYHADLCVCSTTAGHDNLSRDFNVFLVGDAVLATSVANDTPAHATNAAVSYASRQRMITQVSWIKALSKDEQ